MKNKKCLSFSGVTLLTLLPDEFTILADISDLSNWGDTVKIKTMKTKKHKVEIPKGYEVTEELINSNDGVEYIKKTIIFKPIKKELPKTWAAHCMAKGTKPWITKINYQDCFAALRQLIELRDVYNDGWVASHDNADDKFSLVFIEGEIRIVNSCKVIYPLTFKTEELRRSFLDNFSELIEQAKPLL